MMDRSSEKKPRAKWSFDFPLTDFGRRTASGVLTAIVTQAVRVLVQLAGMTVLARMLAPNDFGVLAMATTVTSFAGLLCDRAGAVLGIRGPSRDDCGDGTRGVDPDFCRRSTAFRPIAKVDALGTFAMDADHRSNDRCCSCNSTGLADNDWLLGTCRTTLGDLRGQYNCTLVFQWLATRGRSALAWRVVIFTFWLPSRGILLCKLFLPTVR